MLFSTQFFLLGFLPPVLLLYHLVALDRRLRQLVLVSTSLVFYAAWSRPYAMMLAALTLANWLLVKLWAGRSGVWRGLYPARREARWILDAAILLNLATLAWFKYANFAKANVDSLAGLPFEPWNIVLPLGISFFVFQKLSYLLDLRAGDRHVYRLLDFFEFVTFFPQLIAGPLVRHNEIVPQFAATPRGPHMAELAARGAILFTIGLAKKAALADTLALVCDPLFARAATTPLTLAEAWAAAGTYTLQIYFDFSGYSDMAIGLALLFGLRLPYNFDAPYRACSIREFWRRWHITLSRFLRDYLYIPLGGSRVPAWRQPINVILTMLAGGLWHGAAWSFVAWGGLHGAALAANSAWDRTGLRLPRALGWPMTMLFVVAAWVVFRAPGFDVAASILRSMAGNSGIGSVHVENLPVVPIAVLVAVLGPTSQQAALARLRPRPWLALPAAAAFVFLLLLIGGRVPNEFIYFRF
jgi:alginate O-acetyltransferase complex protein AlgI